VHEGLSSGCLLADATKAKLRRNIGAYMENRAGA
jgi:hypothetical protein